MSNRCLGICPRIEVKRTPAVSPYSEGKKYCPECEIYTFFGAVKCPCCGVHFRTRAKDPGTKKEIT